MPTLRALDELWREISSKPLYAPPHFWRYLKLRLRMRTRLLDPARLPIVAPPGKINDCQGCTDICCIGPRSTVLLRFRDIAQLIDIGRTSLMTHEKPRFKSEELASRPALRRQVNSRAWNSFPVLKQNSFGACMALTTEGKCSLYPHWPLSCARFPYSLHLEDEDIFYSNRCQSFWIKSEARESAVSMAKLAVVAYNERIKDQILLAYAPAQLRELGLLQFIGSK